MALFDYLSRLMVRRVSPARGGTGQPTDMSSLLASLLSMAWFVEARDPYTGGHLWRVSRYAQAVARQMDLGRAAEARIGLGGFLHDLGKIGIADAILRKPDRLTEEEYDAVKTHPSMGARLLAGHPLAELVVDALRLHHERPDGKGYPLGLSGDEIPIMARIVGVCDAFDAMTSHRPYRSGMPEDRALAIIASEIGQQFDAQAAEALLDLGRRDELRHIIGHSQEGIPLQHCGNCGPTLILTPRHQSGQLLYCRNCSGEFRLAGHPGRLLAVSTGGVGRAADLEPDLDIELIAMAVREAVAALPPELLSAKLLISQRQ